MGIQIRGSDDSITPDDGTMTLNGLSGLTVGTVDYPSSGPLSNRNLIINGDMQVAQRGTSQASVTSTTYAGPDRFQHLLGTAGTWTVSQSTEAPEGFGTSLKLDCTTANASLSASSLYLLGQKIEGLNLQHLDYNTVNAKTVTLSFWVRSNKTGTYVCEVTSQTSTRKISQTYTINSVDTWEKKILQIPGDTGGSIPNTNTAEFNVYWWLAAGANWKSGTLNTTWGITADNNRVVGQTVNLADSTANEFYLTGVQLEVGTVATPFEHRSYGDELARCQRYYYTHARENNVSWGVGTYYNSSLIATHIYFPVSMRSAPALDYVTGVGYYLAYRNGTSDAFDAMGIARPQQNGATVDTSTGTSGTAGHGCVLTTNNSNSFIAFTAEL